MCRDVSIIVLILISLAKYSVSAKYEYIMEDDNIFSECHNKSSDYNNLNTFLDFSNATLTLVEGGIAIDGYVTTMWDNEPTDIIQLSLAVAYFDRGFWQPTLLNMKIDNLCSVWLDEKGTFYQFTSHIRNIDEVKRNCLNVAGTTIDYEPFVLYLTYDLSVPLKPGRYRTTYLATATDQLGNPRATPVCAEVYGSFEKLRTK